MTEVRLLAAESVHKRYGNTQALNGASIDLRPGEVHALVGENGAGKSTLIRILAGLVPADDGRILLEGRPLRVRSTADARAAGIAIIHQDFDLAPNLSLVDNLFLGQEPEPFPWMVRRAARHAAARQAFREIGLDADPDELAGRVPVAQRQLLALARALQADPRILVMDEPTSTLAPADAERLLKRVLDLKSSGVAIIFVSHKLEEVFAIADRVTVFRDGRNVGTRDTASVGVEELIAMMVGRDLRTLFLRSGRAPGRPVLEIQDYTAAGAFRDISLTLHAGEILGIYGLKGAGRAALLRAIFGLAPISEGRLRIDGVGIQLGSPAAAIRAGLALVPEDRKSQSLFENMNVREHLSLAALGEISHWGLVRAGEEKRRCAELIGQLGIRLRDTRQAIFELSGGNQQKVVLGRWLFSEPRVLMLDEPTAGIDVGARAEIYRLVDRLAGRGLGIIYVTSELPELLGVSDRVLVMAEGGLVAEFQRGEATEQSIMQAIQAA